MPRLPLTTFLPTLPRLSPPPPPTLSTADLQSLADLALAIWSDALAAQGLSLPAGAPSFLIADLADGVLGQTDGSTITLDLDAAGHGWFVDATPRDAVEFSLYLGTDHLGAVPGSAAAGAMDLLTVLLHEIGHWAGYDHDAGIALMAPVLGTGQRVMLDIGDASPAVGGSVSGSSFVGGVLDLSSYGIGTSITFTVTAPNTITVSGTATGDDAIYPDVNKIIGGAGIDTLQAADVENVWNLTGLNAGFLNAIEFEGVETLTGGDAKDTFIFDQVGAVTGEIDDGDGILELQLFDFFYVSGDFDFTTVNGNLVRNDGHAYDDVDYRVLSGEGVNAFIGNGPPTDPTAVGLSVTALNFTFVQFVDQSNGVGYTALKTSGGTATLVGLEDVLEFHAWDIGVRLNQASNGSAVLDFNGGGSNVGIPVTPSVGPVIDFEGDDGSLLNVVGNAAIDVAGAVVAKGGFELAVGEIASDDLLNLGARRRCDDAHARERGRVRWRGRQFGDADDAGRLVDLLGGERHARVWRDGQHAHAGVDQGPRSQCGVDDR